MTRNTATALRGTVAAMSQPRLVVALGDCVLNRGGFAGAYGVEVAVEDVVPVDVRVAGCRPRPEAIVAALRTVTGR